MWLRGYNIFVCYVDVHDVMYANKTAFRSDTYEVSPDIYESVREVQVHFYGIAAASEVRPRAV